MTSTCVTFYAQQSSFFRISEFRENVVKMFVKRGNWRTREKMRVASADDVAKGRGRGHDHVTPSEEQIEIGRHRISQRYGYEGR